jgi:hypothetical protein
MRRAQAVHPVVDVQTDLMEACNRRHTPCNCLLGEQQAIGDIFSRDLVDKITLPEYSGSCP